MQEISRRKPGHKEPWEEHIEQAVVQMAIDNPAQRLVLKSNELGARKGILISASGVRSIWLRNDMETFQKRLKVLSPKWNKRALSSTRTKWRHWRKQKKKKQAHGEIETYYPGFLVAPRHLIM